MSSPPSLRADVVGCVVDAGVLAKLFLSEPETAVATALMSHVYQPAVVRAVPELALAECANVLWKNVRRGFHPAAAARRDIVRLVGLPLDIYPHQLLAPTALDLALQYGISAYDALYVALADQLALPLVTADARLMRAMMGSPVEFHLLASIII